MAREGVHILIVAGEASGDLYGSLLMQAMRGGRFDPGTAAGPLPGEAEAAPPVRFTGVGGAAMRSAGLLPLGDADAMGVTGFLEVLGSAGAIWRSYRAARALLRSADRPDLVILIDYPDFNLRLAAHAQRARVPVLYFVSPQVWAWRRGRVRGIATNVDRMLVILPFEEEFYRRAGVPVEFVGHPLLDILAVTSTRDQVLRPLGLDPRRPTVALLPGSRRNELRAHLGVMLGAAGRLREEFRDLQFLLPIAPTLSASKVEEAIRAERTGVHDCVLVTDGRYEALSACDAAVVASGTATVETALLQVPMVVVYRMNAITFAIARLLSHVPHVAMPNLIAGERVIPELIQGDCTPERIAAELRRILIDPQVSGSMRQALSSVRTRMGRPGAIGRVASTAWDMIRAPGREHAA